MKNNIITMSEFAERLKGYADETAEKYGLSEDEKAKLLLAACGFVGGQSYK